MSEYRLDGTDLDDAAGRWRLTDVTTLPTLGAPRLSSVTVPGRNGVLPIAPTTVAPIEVTLGFMVTDAAASGQTGRRGLDENLRALYARLRRVGEMSDLVHYPAAGTPKRHAAVRVSASIEPKLYPAANVAEVKVVLEAPAGVWEDVDSTTSDAADLAGLDGGVMPITAPLVLAVPSADGSPLRVVDVVSATSLQWSGARVASRTLLIDPASYRATWTNNGWSGGEDVSAGLSISSPPFAITPDVQGHHAVTVTGGTAQIRARRAY